MTSALVTVRLAAIEELRRLIEEQLARGWLRVPEGASAAPGVDLAAEIQVGDPSVAIRIRGVVKELGGGELVVEPKDPRLALQEAALLYEELLSGGLPSSDRAPARQERGSRALTGVSAVHHLDPSPPKKYTSAARAGGPPGSPPRGSAPEQKAKEDPREEPRRTTGLPPPGRLLTPSPPAPGAPGAGIHERLRPGQRSITPVSAFKRTMTAREQLRRERRSLRTGTSTPRPEPERVRPRMTRPPGVKGGEASGRPGRAAAGGPKRGPRPKDASRGEGADGKAIQVRPKRGATVGGSGVSLESSMAREELEDLRREVEAFLEGTEGPDMYRVLGVDHGATTEEIRRAFFRLVKRYHPDRYFQWASGEVLAKLELAYQRVCNAHAVLSIPRRRRQHDVMLARGDAPTQRAPIQGGHQRRKATEGAIHKLMSNAQRAYRHGDLEGSRRLLKMIEALAPDVGEAKTMLERVEAELAGGRNKVERHVRVLLQQATAARKAGHQGKARLLLEEALRLDPKNAEVKRRLAMLDRN